MAVLTGELYRSVCMSFDHELLLTAGDNSADIPVLRLTVIGDRASAERIRKYDAVIFHAENHKKCSILDAAEALNANGACAMLISSQDYGVYELEQLRILCASLSLPLVEIQSTDYLPALINLINEKMNGLYEESLEIGELLLGVIRMPEYYGDYGYYGYYSYYGELLAEHGFYEYSDYCVAVFQFVSRRDAFGSRKDVVNASRYIETGLGMKAAAAVLPMGFQVAVVFADVDTDDVVRALRRGLDAVPDDITSEYSIYIGVSDRARGIDCVPALLNLAAKTALMQQRRGNEGCPVRYSEHNLNKFMVSLKDSETIESLINDTLLQLAEYDRKNDTDYINFLKVYFRNNCSLQRTAKELYIHRNSVNYALRKIESIIGRSLSDINTKAELILGLGFLELSRDEPFFRCEKRSQGGMISENNRA